MDKRRVHGDEESRRRAVWVSRRQTDFADPWIKREQMNEFPPGSSRRSSHTNCWHTDDKLPPEVQPLSAEQVLGERCAIISGVVSRSFQQSN